VNTLTLRLMSSHGRKCTDPGHLDRRQYVVAQRDREGVGLLTNLYGLILRRGIDIFRHGPDVSATLNKGVRRVWSGMDNDLEGIRRSAAGKEAKAGLLTILRGYI
jgi:hypothetical protein